MIDDNQESSKVGASQRASVPAGLEVPYIPTSTKTSNQKMTDRNTEEFASRQFAIYGMISAWIIALIGTFADFPVGILCLLCLILPLYGLTKIKDSGDLAWVVGSSFLVLVAAAISFFMAAPFTF
jgi:hypothetical protein